ncbi:protein N-terminal glutamine amidohydrolase isoform X2 [Manihot esculenta]|uniref:Uncharacterized protein n=1 Tax=Manihot esculenta TaxID=3983 RepID=A0ACB7H390_MANES|nr:protein N-terminal glutamine amidohydrolase isoform X2 [Manihot esculenta]KAG8646680.1 hypothetical protein MANES_09G022100v8 [Manihot esculenta]
MTTTNLEVRVNAVNVSQFDHTPFYCEENVYFLCKKLCQIGTADAEGSDLFVAFISNEKKQRKGDGDSPCLVWDLDSSLPFPSPLAVYVSETIRPSFQLFSDYQRFFRIVHAPLFLRYFASDRRHMKDSTGNWIAQPPAYEPIVAEDGTVHNLNEYMEIYASNELTDMGADSVNLVFNQKHGVVISESRVEELFSLIS